jgi:hypothetical protein
VSDNYHFDIAAEGRKAFELAMKFAFNDDGGMDPPHMEHKARGYRIDPAKGLIFYWSVDSDGTAKNGVSKLPYEMKLKAAVEFAWSWLEAQDYPPEPDHDGSNHKGWRVYNEAWNRIGDEWGAFAAIQPEWMMYGK